MRLVLCEGKHANSALQGLLNSAFGCEVRPPVTHATKPEWYQSRPGAGERLHELRSPGGSQIFLHGIGGKDNLRSAIRLRVGTGRLIDTELIAVSFDPDEQREGDWRQYFEERIRSAGLQAQRAGWHYMAGAAPGLAVLPLPWLSPSIALPGKLPDVQSLYRATAQALRLGFPRRGRFIDIVTRIAWKCGTRPNWKTVCWFWMAAWHAEAECDHFFREAFSLREVHDVLRAAPHIGQWWEALGRVAQ